MTKIPSDVEHQHTQRCRGKRPCLMHAAAASFSLPAKNQITTIIDMIKTCKSWIGAISPWHHWNNAVAVQRRSVWLGAGQDQEEDGTSPEQAQLSSRSAAALSTCIYEICARCMWTWNMASHMKSFWHRGIQHARKQKTYSVGHVRAHEIILHIWWDNLGKYILPIAFAFRTAWPSCNMFPIRWVSMLYHSAPARMSCVLLFFRHELL